MGLITGGAWMIGIGIGLYLGYIPFNAFLYERMIAAFRYVSNSGFVIYVSDSFGYLGSMCVILFKYTYSHDMSWISFFIKLSFWLSLTGGVLIMLALIFFKRKYIMYRNINNYENLLNVGEPLLTTNSGSFINQ
jgi:hypothetical protein